MRREAMVVVAVLAAGCAGSAADGSSDEAMPSSDVAASMEVKVGGDRVRFLLHVTNTGDESLELTFPSSQRYDFMVHTADGESVWTWSADKAFLQAISHVALAPGETWGFEAEWDAGNRTGRYQVVGRVTAQEHDVQQSAGFELP